MKKLFSILLSVVLVISTVACVSLVASAADADTLAVAVVEKNDAKFVEVTYESQAPFMVALLEFEVSGVTITDTDGIIDSYVADGGNNGKNVPSAETSPISEGKFKLLIQPADALVLAQYTKVVVDIPVTISAQSEFSVKPTKAQAAASKDEDGKPEDFIEISFTGENDTIADDAEGVTVAESASHTHNYVLVNTEAAGHYKACDCGAIDPENPLTAHAAATHTSCENGKHEVFCSCGYDMGEEDCVDGDDEDTLCDKCGFDLTPAHEHVFGELQYKVEGGNCITYKECECGETETVASIANLELKPNLVLASGLSIRFRIPKTSLSAYSNIYGSFTKDVYSGATCTGVSAEEIISAVDQGNAQTGNKQFEYKGIASYEMTATIHAKIFATNGDGVVVLVSALEYQFADYFKSNIAGGVTGTTNTKERLDFYANTLRYGSASQIRNNYNTSDLADKLLDGSFGTDLPTTFTNTDAVSSGSVTIEPNAVVGNSLMFRIRFLKSAVSQVNDLKLSISYTNASGVATTLVVDQFTDASNGTKYQYEFSDLPCAFIGDYFTVKILDGTTEVASLQYCFQKYASEKYATSVTSPTETNRTLGTLCQAIIAYSTSAKAVFVK